MAGMEHYTGAGNETTEVEKAAAERSAELREKAAEAAAEHNEKQAEREADEARAEAHKEAKSTEEHRPTNQENAKDVGASGMGRDKAYRQTMKTIQGELSAPQRIFSKIIHNKAVEAVSDVVGATVARPNAILSGAFCAFVAVLGVYSLAKYMGFALYGGETIAAFVIGWLFGLLFDLLRTMFGGRRKR
jgi:hypothetical protein